MSDTVPVGPTNETNLTFLAAATACVVLLFFAYGFGANAGKASGYQKGVEAGKREIMEAIAKQEPWEYLGVRYFVGDERIYRKKHPEMFRHVPPQVPRLR